MTNTCSVHAEWTAPRPGMDLYFALRDRIYVPWTSHNVFDEFRFPGRGKVFAVTPARV